MPEHTLTLTVAFRAGLTDIHRITGRVSINGEDLKWKTIDTYDPDLYGPDADADGDGYLDDERDEAVEYLARFVGAEVAARMVDDEIARVKRRNEFVAGHPRARMARADAERAADRLSRARTSKTSRRYARDRRNALNLFHSYLPRDLR